MQTKPEPTIAPPGALIDIDDLDVHYQLRGGSLARLFGQDTGTVRAVDGVTLSLRKGEVLGLVGESGSGKTTLGRALLGLVRPTSGAIRYHREGGVFDIASASNRELRKIRTELQMVFQDPHASLNPSMTIETAVGHPLQIHGIASGAELSRLVGEALERVGLAPAEQFMSKYPSDLSGGQKQRAVLARAVILDPDLLVADEPISMLDMSVRAKILQLMQDLKADLGLTYVYITHDLATAKYFCDRVAIMYLGRIVEIGPTDEIFADPKHPYTKALLKAIPDIDPAKMVPRDLPRGEIPDAANPPSGCAFHPRCPEAVAECGWEARDLGAMLEEHWTRREPSVYEREQEIVGRMALFEAAEKSVTFAARNPAEGHRILESIRAESPGDPLWNGVSEISEDTHGVTVTFHRGVDPALRQADGVEVACILHPVPVTLEPTASD